MFRSLYSGVSGMTAQMTSLDVIGNNIANSSTVGFKSGRASFTDLLSQTMRGATQPTSGGLGGTNPLQVGLGTRVGSIDTYFRQGSFQSTGKKTDLALEGNGFFVLDDGTSRHYTRAGVFGFDASHTLVNPATGWRVQGLMADAEGNIGGGAFGDIVIDPDTVTPPRASALLEVMGNLPGGGEGQGSVVRSDAFLAAATATDTLVGLRGQDGTALGLRPGDVIRLGGQAGGANLGGAEFTVDAETTYGELVRWLNAQTQAAGRMLSFDIAPDGSVTARNGGPGDVQSLAVYVVNRPDFNANFHFDVSIPEGETSSTAGLRDAATAGDRLADLYRSDGTGLGLEAGSSSLAIGGVVGGQAVPEATLAVGPGTTLGDLMGALQDTLGATTTPATLDDSGRIVLTGETGTAHSLDTVTVRDAAAAGTLVGFQGLQVAEDPAMATVATTVTDALGHTHSVRIDFAKIPGGNDWTWTATLEGGETVLAGGSGRLSFDSDGTFLGATYDDGSGALSFAAAGTEPVTLALDFGTAGGLDGLTQFAGAGSVSALADGYGAGSLVDFEIGTDGTITGIFSNDTTRTLARVGVSRFANPDGLSRQGNNAWRPSANSGVAVDMFAGDGTGVIMRSGSLEASNVDLAKEFTDLVVAQRAFQANSRVISTADEIMRDLVNLI
jgi:flagellar hook protein FlgE